MIVFENISKQYGSTVLFESVSASFKRDQRTGLIGVNGSGKTTLLRMFSGEESPDRGNIRIPSGLRMGYLPQEVEVMDDKTPIEIILEPFAHLMKFEEHLSNATERTDDIKTAMREIDKLYDQMEYHDGYSIKSRAEAILSGLGIPKENWELPVQQLSGGYRMRAVLGRLLLTLPDFLLLDEPTNHLDMDSLVWLEKYLQKHKGGMLIVSHDRDFLNRITTTTAEISGRSITIYKGNYNQYIEMKKEAEASELSRTRNLETRIAQTERFVERFKAKATKASQAQSRMKLLEKLKADLPSVTNEQKSIDFSFPDPKSSGSVPLKFTGVSAGYENRTVLENFTLTVTRGDKIAVVGPNGAGKSTFLKLAAGMITQSKGIFEPGHNVTIRYFGQHQLEQLDPEKTLYETVISDSINTEKTFVRNILGAFLFSGDSVDKKVKVLSGGEKARLVLAKILASPGNVLLLDEPTNHLDINSIEMLSDAMTGFKGTIIFVSHDEYFISRIATRIVEIRPGVVRDFPGTLKDYREYLDILFDGDNSKSNTPSQKEKSVPDEKELRIKDRESRKKLTRTIEKLEREIASHEEKIGQLRSILDDPSNALNHEFLYKTTQELENTQRSLDELFLKWEEGQIELSTFESQ
jgi:ATP-binding cassette subfamily F protein 3